MFRGKGPAPEKVRWLLDYLKNKCDGAARNRNAMASIKLPGPACEFIAWALGRYLSGEAKTLDNAFGASRKCSSNMARDLEIATKVAEIHHRFRSDRAIESRLQELADEYGQDVRWIRKKAGPFKTEGEWNYLAQEIYLRLSKVETKGAGGPKSK